MRVTKPFRVRLFFLITCSTAGLLAQTTEYHDSPSGLEKLAKDIMKAQKDNNGARAGALLDGFVLPNYDQWYRENFDQDSVHLALPRYVANSRTLSMQLAKFFVDAQKDDYTSLQVKRFDKSCDDNANEQTFNTLDARLKGVPLYELRLVNGGHFLRLFAFAYVDGGFRYVLTPDFNGKDAHTPKNTSDSEVREITADPTGEHQQLRLSGTVQAAKLIKRVQPIYPEVARGERLSGTVRLHAIIAKDGSVSGLRVLYGRCSLARAAVDAVRQWRYSPTLLNGQPLEVDTTIEVIFEIRQ